MSYHYWHIHGADCWCQERADTAWRIVRSNDLDMTRDEGRALLASGQPAEIIEGPEQ